MNDYINLDTFRAFPRFPWLKNWFRKAMSTASGTVVSLLAIPGIPDLHPVEEGRQ
jgi:hypothetical protein